MGIVYMAPQAVGAYDHIAVIRAIGRVDPAVEFLGAVGGGADANIVERVYQGSL